MFLILNKEKGKNGQDVQKGLDLSRAAQIADPNRAICDLNLCGNSGPGGIELMHFFCLPSVVFFALLVFLFLSLQPRTCSIMTGDNM